MRFPDPKLSFEQQDDLILFAMCLYGEARNQSDLAVTGAGCAVRNRVQDTAKRNGDGWKQVILKPWAFSSFNPGDPNRSKLVCPLKHDAPCVWERCLRIASALYNGGQPDITNGATHYYDTSLVKPPNWARFYPFTLQLGAFRFHRQTPAGDQAAAVWRRQAGSHTR